MHPKLRRPTVPALIALLAMLTSTALAAPAHAGTSFQLGVGTHPEIAVEPGGTAHVVFGEGLQDEDARVIYCRVPRGTRACGDRKSLTPPTGSGGYRSGQPVVLFAPPSTVYIVYARYVLGDVLLWTSSDGGSSFGAPVRLAGEGSGIGGTDFYAAALAPDGSISLSSGNPGSYYQNVRPGGPLATSRASLPGNYIDDHWVGLYGPMPVTVGSSFGGTGGFTMGQVASFRYDGSGSLNDAANWIGPSVVGPGSSPRLAGGGDQLFLMMGTPVAGGVQWQVRAFNGTAFAAPVNVGPPVEDYLDENDIDRSPSGAVSVVFTHTGPAESPARIRLSTSIDNGASFSRPVDIVRQDELTTELRIGTAADNQGFVVWRDLKNDGEVRMASLEPLPGGPGTPPPPPPPGDTTPPAFSALSLSPNRFAAARRGGSTVSRGGTRVSYRLSEPASVRFFVRRIVSGRRVGGRCVSARRANRQARRCNRYTTVPGNFTHRGAAGQNRFRFSGRLRNRRLAPGRYRLEALAVDAAGNRSNSQRIGFQIVRR